MHIFYRFYAIFLRKPAYLCLTFYCQLSILESIPSLEDTSLMSIPAIQHAVSESIDARKAALVNASDAIWDHPQVNFHEDYAADMLC